MNDVSLITSETPGIAVDIDETLSQTNLYWMIVLCEQFGSPDNLEPREVMRRYRYTQQVSHWDTPAALAWMENARNSDELQRALPLIEDSNHVLRRIHTIVPVVAYITARPEIVRDGTLHWLDNHEFPKAPLIMRPDGMKHFDSIAWKAKLLSQLYPRVWGIIDDHPGLIRQLPSSYQGTVFLYDHPDEIPKTDIRVVSVANWKEAYRIVTEHLRT